MAYMHRETFDIIQGSNIDSFLDDYFDIDDYIAKPIQTLNRKGYRTKYCCSGHPFDDIFESYYSGEEQDPHRIMPGVLSYESTEDGRLHILAQQACSNRAYVVFDESVVFECAPPNEWYWENSSSLSCCWEPCVDPLECLQIISYAMGMLQQWADALPDLSNAHSDAMK